MNKNLILYILLAGFLFACQDEDALEPSFKDIDRVAAQVDLSQPTIKQIYEDFNVGVLYEYDSVLDFAYTAQTASDATRWGSVEIPEIKSLFIDKEGNLSADTLPYYNAYIDAAVAFVDTAIFKYIEPGSFIAGKLPRHLLISASVYADDATNVPALTESESRSSRYTYGALNVVYNNNSIVVNVNQDDVANNTKKIIINNFYVFLAKVLEMNNLYEQIPTAFYEGKNDYYGVEMDALYRADMGIDEETTVYVVDRNWVYSKGFIDAIYFYNGTTGLGNVFDYSTTPSTRYTKAFRPTYEFVSGHEKDVRSYLSEILHRNASEIQAFPENIQQNMRLLYDTFAGWGIKLVELNPDLEVLNNEE